jgi:hypothetical protein
MFMPFCLLALHRYLDGHRPRDLAMAGVCWMLNALSTGYYLIFFAVLMAAWLPWFVRTRRDWVAIGATLGTAMILLAPLLVGYEHYQKAFGFVRGRGEIEMFSADVTAFWTVSPYAWLPRHWSLATRPEGELYQGIAIVALTVVAAWKSWRPTEQHARRRAQYVVAGVGAALLVLASVVWLTGGWQANVGPVALSMTHPHRVVGVALLLLVVALVLDVRFESGWRRRSIFLFYVSAACLMCLFALGPVAHIAGTRFIDKAPYFWLMQMPGGSALRVPARFGMLVALCLSQAGAIAFARLTPRGARPLLVGALAVAVLADGWVPDMRIAAAPEGMPLNVADGVPVLELPSRSLYDDAEAMLRATGHDHPLVNGFSGFVPPHYPPLQEALLGLDETVFDAIRGDGPLLVVINASHDADGAIVAWLAKLPGIQPQPDTAIGPAFLIPRSPKTPVEPRGYVGISRVSASRNSAAAPAAVDGDERTRWHTDAPQGIDDQFSATLERRAVISAVEMDLADSPADYPRQLRISVSDGAGPLRPIWKGSTASAVVRGALADGGRIPIVLELPPDTIGDRVVLTSRAAHPEAYWSIAELRVLTPAAARPAAGQ